MVNLVIEDSSDFTLDEFERVNCGEEKAHLQVGKDSAGSHKGHESKFLSSHFQKISGGGPPSGLHCSSVGFHLTGPFPDLSLDPCLEHHRKFIDSAGSQLSAGSHKGHCIKFLSSPFQKLWGRTFIAPESGCT